MTENAMDAVLLSVLKTDLAIPDRWQMASVHVSTHKEVITGDPDATPPTEDQIIIHRSVNATLMRSSITLVFVLEGLEGEPPASCKVHYKGTPLITDDADLIARIDNAVGPMLEQRQGELLDAINAPIEEPS